MSWRDTWRETVASFLREVRDPAATPDEADPVVSAIAAARGEVAAVERELAGVEARHGHEEQAAAMCERRRTMAERIGDTDTATVAERFRRRHAERAALLSRKAAVLRDEVALARASLNDLLDYARAAHVTGPPGEAS